jgi:hypothetical protein
MISAAQGVTDPIPACRMKFPGDYKSGSNVYLEMSLAQARRR